MTSEWNKNLKLRIAYVAPYQGRELMQRRPFTRNLALAGNLKIELISELLARRGHDVEIISQGEVVENSTRFFPAFSEPTPRNVTVRYASAWPVRFVNGYWSSRGVRAIFKQRHAEKPFDAVIVYNLKVPQVDVALYAREVLGLPVVVEFEDDSFVDVVGQASSSALERWHRQRELAVLNNAIASICVSPHLQTRFPKGVPSLLLRGVISEEILTRAQESPAAGRKNIVAFSGTFAPSKGLSPLIEAWKLVQPADWELHIAGDGAMAAELRQSADGVKSIRFLGLLDRRGNARFLAEAKIGINPHELSAVPGNVFAFKIIEYLAAGLHVISTPMGPVEEALERGMTYIENNTPEVIAKSLNDVILGRRYLRTATDAAVREYGGESVAASLDQLVRGAAGKWINSKSGMAGERVSLDYN